MLKPGILAHYLKALFCLSLLLPQARAHAQLDRAQTRPVSLRDCVAAALLHNRTLQIERINPEVARLSLEAAYGYYDPLFFSEIRKEASADTGGFDPADFSRDAIYDAESEIAGGGLTGFLPSGMSYSLAANYAHSDGTRNLFNFDSYKLVGGVAVRQPLLKNFWTDQGRTAIRINKKTVKISELGVHYVMMDTINQVQQAYFELLFATEDLKVRQDLLNAKQETLAGIRRQVEVGTLTVLEEKLARSSASRVEAELVAASNVVLLAENALRSLIGQSVTEWKASRLRPSDRLLVVPEQLDLGSSWEAGFNLRPDLAQMVQDIERFGIDLQFRRNQLFPSLDFVASYGRRGADAIQAIPPAPADASLPAAWDQIANGDAPSHSFGLVLTTPLGRTRERASYKAARQLKEQAQIKLRQKEEMVLREISDALHNARSAFDRSAATRRAKAEAREALEAEQQKLTVGTSTLFFVLQLQSDLADAESTEVRARADYNKALSQLHFTEGSLLERHRLNVELK